HRFVWDLHEESPRVAEPTYAMSAIPADTPAEPRGPWALPGLYTVELIAGEGTSAHTVTRTLTVNMDPRVKTPLPDLRVQHALSRALAEAITRTTAMEASLPKESTKAVRDVARRLKHALAMVQQADLLPTPQLAAAAAAVLAEE